MNNKFAILKNKILRNLDKICLDPIGYLANAELLKNFKNLDDYTKNEFFIAERSKQGLYKIKDNNGEEINCEAIFRWPNWESAKEDYQEIGQAIVARIKNSPTDWEIIKEEGEEKGLKWKIARNKKTGLKHYQPFFLTTPSFLVEEKAKIWDEIETVLKKFPSTSQKPSSQIQEQKQWYKPTDYPIIWITVTFLSLLLATIIFLQVKKAKK